MPRPRLDIADLVRRSRALATGSAGGEPAGRPQRLQDLPAFGSNPGGLRLRAFLPASLPPRAPLLVVLHGCTQTAAGFDHGCGWSDLAESHGFALLAPEQRQANNQNRCFNWFEPGDTARGQGEAESLRAGIAHMVATHGLDPGRVFITGLSAGGAMAAAMLATHPEVFAAGAIFAGLPFGAAATMPEAFEAMAAGRPRPAADWAALARTAAAPRHGGPWPRVSIWHGEADTTVRPVNATELAKQWAALHGLHAEAGRPDGPGRRVWHDAAGEARVELTLVPGLAHGVPIHPGEGPDRAGRPMPFILDAGISAPHRILGFFGLAPMAEARTTGAAMPEAPLADRTGTPRTPGVIVVAPNGQARFGTPAGAAPPPGQDVPERPMAGAAAWDGTDPGSVIRRALTAAGLMPRR